ncbi:MAG: aminoglycoside phosphotransferase family protein [Actinomycetota bacterium]|nr:aminoglycoside phosphotransferase family protein [Actinomycetota bacterium]
MRSSVGAAGVLAALREKYSLDPPYLRPAMILRDDGEQTATALCEFDAPDGDWEPKPTDLEWLTLAEADPQALAPPELAPFVEKWLAIARGAPIPKARPPWARAGWLAEASAWMDARIGDAGLQPDGPLEVVEQWPLSSVLRRATGHGRVYVKAAFSIFHHEPALTRALGAEHPTLVPEVLAVELERGWMLMREVPGTLICDLDVERWSEALPSAAAIHLHWAGRADELFQLGATDRTLAALASEIRSTFEAVELVVDDRTASRLEEACEELSRGPLPQTLVHGDLHPWNVMADGNELRIFDWSDACVSHPSFDLPTFLIRRADVAARRALLDAYLDEWTSVASRDELLRAYALAEPLAHVHHAISYLQISEALEPDDRWWFDDAPKRWLDRALESLEAA